MRTLIKYSVYILAIWAGIQFAYYVYGYKKTSDATYDIDIPEVKAARQPFDTTLLKPPSKVPYKGKWVDIN